jgi:hypothetical protein
MTMKLSSTLVTAALLAGLSTTASAQLLVQDDFSLPNGTFVGFNWVEANNDLEIINQAVRGKFQFMNDTWMYHSSFAQPHATSKAVIDFGATTGDIFFGAGVVIGLDHNTWGGTAVRVTDNDLDGLFDRIFFMAAINAGAWYTQSTPIWYDLPVQVSAGQLTVWAEPADDMVAARVEDANGNLIGTYTASGIAASPFAPTGSDVGIWISSRAKADNFFAMEHRILDAFPSDISLAAGGEQILDLSFGGGHAGELYLLLASASGTAPGTPLGGGLVLPLNADALTSWTFLNINHAPYSQTLGTLDAQGHGRTRLTLPAGILPGLAGLTINHAAISLSLGGVPTSVSNAATVTLLP